MRNKSTNKDGAVNYGSDWYVYYYKATIAQEWPTGETFWRVKQMTSIELSTFTDYTLSNPDVTLTVFFTDYDTSAAYWSETSSTSTTKELVFDKSLWTSTAPYTDTGTRKVIAGYTGATAPAATDPRWVDSMTINYSFTMYDCEVDFVTETTNLAMLT